MKVTRDPADWNPTANDVGTPTYATVAELLASTLPAQGQGSIWRAASYVYEEAATGASDQDVTTAGSVKLYVLPIEGRYPLEAFGFATTNTATQNKTIMRAALDKGPCSAGEGQFPLKSFLITSDDDFWGAGYGTHFYSDGGIIFKPGCMAGDSFTIGDPDCSPYYTINSVTLGDPQMTLTTAAQAANFTQGGTAVIWSSTGYTDAGGEFKPAYQQIVGVVSVDAGTGAVVLEEPIYRDTPAAATMYATPGQVVTGRDQNGDVGISRNVKFGNFSVTESTGTDSWGRYGGTYKSEFGPIWPRKSARAVVFNGLAYSTVRIPHATISKHLVDCSMFCHHTTYQIDAWDEMPTIGNGGFPLVNQTEGPHHNTIIVGPGYARDTTQRVGTIFFGDCHDQTVIVGNVQVTNTTALVLTSRRASSAMEYKDNKLILQGELAAKTCNHAINHAVTTAGDEYPLTITGGRLYAPAAATSQVTSNASRLLVDCEIDAPATKPITVNAASKDINLERARFINLPSAFPTNTQVRMPRTFGTGKEIGGLVHTVTTGTAITGGTTFVSAWSMTVPAGSFRPGDAIPILFFGTCTGTAGAKNFAIKVTTNGVTVTTSVQFAAAFADDFSGTAAVSFTPTADTQRMNIAVIGNGGYSGVDTQPGTQAAAANSMLIEVGAFSGNAGDSIFMNSVVPLIPGRN